MPFKCPLTAFIVVGGQLIHKCNKRPHAALKTILKHSNIMERFKLKTSERVAYIVCDMLHKMGIKTLSDYREKPIKTTMRASWYVDKLLQHGHTDCVHINLDNLCGFLVVTEDGHIMSGSNIMIADAFTCLACDFNLPFEHMAWDMWTRWDGFEDAIVICELRQFRKFLQPALSISNNNN